MNITLLCTDKEHPVNDFLMGWISCNKNSHNIYLSRTRLDLPGGDILFLISCSELIPQDVRSLYIATLTLHASDLPVGRGWSPHIWSIIEGSTEVTLSLIEAVDKVDTGRVWRKVKFEVPQHCLWNEINSKLFQKEIELLDFAVANFSKIEPIPQNLLINPTYYPRRSPLDSEINPSKDIESQFNKMRTCDPDRFPAFFLLHGHKYKIVLEKIDD
jgi:methionyl-tRNA formyltransferase